MYTVTVRDHVMVAHSLPDPFFGPAQGLHGATYVVETTWERPDLDEHGVVVDIGAATEALREVLGRLAYRNLDEVEELAGRLTTTEFLARWVAERLAEALEAQGSGRDLAAITVVLREHPDAWASYRLRLRWSLGHPEVGNGSQRAAERAAARQGKDDPRQRLRAVGDE